MVLLEEITNYLDNNKYYIGGWVDGSGDSNHHNFFMN